MTFRKRVYIRSHWNQLLKTDEIWTGSLRKMPIGYAVPKIKMSCNLHCLKARLRLLCNKYQRYGSLNLVSQQLRLCNTFIFGMAYYHILQSQDQCVKFTSETIDSAERLVLMIISSSTSTMNVFPGKYTCFSILVVKLYFASEVCHKKSTCKIEQ